MQAGATLSVNHWHSDTVMLAHGFVIRTHTVLPSRPQLHAAIHILVLLKTCIFRVNEMNKNTVYESAVLGNFYHLSTEENPSKITLKRLNMGLQHLLQQTMVCCMPHYHDCPKCFVSSCSMFVVLQISV